MNHRCGHPKVSKICRICNKLQAREKYRRLQAGPPIWRDLATMPWLQHTSGGSQ